MGSLASIIGATDNIKPPAYVPIYEQIFAPLRHQKLKILELGVFQGGSLKVWERYFPHAEIAGLDLRLPGMAFDSGRVRMFEGDQSDPGILDRIAAEVAPDGFDIVIDDAAHIAALAKASFWHLFEHHLRPGALYCIEDWGTGYWNGWPDGSKFETFESRTNGVQRRFPSHDFGMVGFVKQLVDECHYNAIKDTQVLPNNRPSRFACMSIYAGLVVVTKAADPDHTGKTGG